jgi:hypothetical protein
MSARESKGWVIGIHDLAGDGTHDCRIEAVRSWDTSS